MANTKLDFDVAVAFAEQSAEGTYDPTLDAVTNSLSGDPDGTDDGLLLGDAESGIGGSGLDFEAERIFRDSAEIGSSFTRGLSNLVRVDIPTFDFAVPFCGNRGQTTGTPVDGDFIPLTGINALLAGVGLTGTAWGSGVGHSYKPDWATVKPISALVYHFGNRYELLDCRLNSLALEFTADGFGIAKGSVAVGSVQDPSSDTIAVQVLPATLDYGAQATISAPSVINVANTWGIDRGFQTLTVTIAPAIEDIPDSNKLNSGIVKEPTGHSISVTGSMFSDAAGSGEVFELKQLFADAIADLNQLSFQVGSDAAGSDPALAVQILVPDPELVRMKPIQLGTKAGIEFELNGRSATANEELEIIFR